MSKSEYRPQERGSLVATTSFTRFLDDNGDDPVVAARRDAALATLNRIMVARINRKLVERRYIRDILGSPQLASRFVHALESSAHQALLVQARKST